MLSPSTPRIAPPQLRLVGIALSDRSRLLLGVDVHGERSVIALGPVGEAADPHTGESIHPRLGHKAVVDVERFLPW